MNAISVAMPTSLLYATSESSYLPSKLLTNSGAESISSFQPDELDFAFENAQVNL